MEIVTAHFLGGLIVGLLLGYLIGKLVAKNIYAPRPNENNNVIKPQILASLDDGFTTQQAIRQFEEFDYKKRQAMNYLNTWIEQGLIERIKTGNYRKL